MKHVFVVLLITLSTYANALDGPSKWLCRSNIKMSNAIMSEQHIIDQEDQRIVAIESDSYALTIEATEEKLALHIMRKRGDGAGILAASTANRKDSLKATLMLPLQDGYINMSCERATDEGQSDKDRVVIKDIQHDRSPAVNSLYIKRILPGSFQQ